MHNSYCLQSIVPFNHLDDVVKFLGVYIDWNLTWKPHLHHISIKVAKAIGIITKRKFYIGPKTLRTLYLSLIYPYLYYSNIVVGSTYPTNLNRITSLQKRIVRIITKSGYNAHTDLLFKCVHFLKLVDVNRYQTGLFLFSHHNNTLLSSYDNLLTAGTQTHKYNTR